MSTDSEHIAAEAAHWQAIDYAQERIRELEAELARIRPVYEAAIKVECGAETSSALFEALRVARSKP